MNITDQVIGVVESPCINICEVDDTNVCTGCYRSLDEIAAWSSVSDFEQKVIVEKANKRKEAAK